MFKKLMVIAAMYAMVFGLVASIFGKMEMLDYADEATLYIQRIGSNYNVMEVVKEGSMDTGEIKVSNIIVTFTIPKEGYDYLVEEYGVM